MRFAGEWDTVECDDCGRRISTSEDRGFEGVHYCYGCSGKHKQEFVKSLCILCNHPMGDSGDYMWDENGDAAHNGCIEKLPQEKQDEWSDEF